MKTKALKILILQAQANGYVVHYYTKLKKVSINGFPAKPIPESIKQLKRIANVRVD